jgi:uncharacterized protein
MALRGVKRVWEVCEPHPDVFARDPDPSLFAISLHHVVQGHADRDYTDPERFFSRTYMTRALSDLLERVIGRLAGQGRGAPILRLETPFGGGKTHTMTALYHIARNPEELSEHEVIKPILERLNLRALPTGVHVAVLDGRSLEVRERRINGITIRTLWGELAFQLGGKEGYEMVADADEARIAPGSELIDELAATLPTSTHLDRRSAGLPRQGEGSEGRRQQFDGTDGKFFGRFDSCCQRYSAKCAHRRIACFFSGSACR